MKKCILFIVLCCITTAFSQNIPPQPLSGINWNDTTVFASLKQTRFTLGWQWGSPERKVNQRLHTSMMNEKLEWSGIRDIIFPTISDTGAPTDLGWEGFQIPPSMNQYSMGVWGFNAPSLQFDPDAPQALSQTQPVRLGDKTGAVFGFSYRNMRIGTLTGDTTNENFNRYILKKDSIASGADSVVLRDPVLNDQYQQDGGDIINSGRQWYLSINLRRTDAADQTTGSQPVLRIKVPYERVSGQSPDSIIFDQIAVSSATAGNLDTLPFGRGLALKMQPAPNNSTKEFVITRDMLPREGTTGTLPRDITISALFRFKSNFDPNAQNDTLIGLGQSVQRINKIKLEVHYYGGNNNIAIDWLRFETPFSRSLFRGYEDTTRFLRYVKYNVDTILRTAINNGVNARLKTFYGADEPPKIEWRGQRYYNLLLNKRFTTESYDNLIKYAIGYNYPWRATMPRCLQTATWPPTVPYIKYGGGLDHLSLKRGMDSSNLYFHPYSRDGSTYETWLRWNRPGYGWTQILMGPEDKSQSNHKDNLPYPDCVQGDNDGGPLAAIEGSAYELSKEESLYDGSVWWTNVQGQHEWYGGKASGQKYLGNQFRRPQTGEEFRIPMWMCLILGGKGLLYDRMYTMPLANANTITTDFSNSMTAGMMGYTPTTTTNNMTGDQLVKDKETGSDFIELNDFTNMDSYINRAQIGTNLGVDSNRIYIGRRSTRCEMMKVHDFIRANDALLMRLRLAAWYGKGYRIFESNDGTRALRNFLRVGNEPPEFPNSPIFKTPLTRPIGRVNVNELLQVVPYPEPWDSAFVDYTILRDTATPTTDEFFVGCLNRRTTPFLLWPNGGSSPSDTVRFFTTAEFDSIVTVTPSLKYKQGGARTITVPFGFNNSTGYALLRVQELGGGIDTIVGQDKDLAVNFLPGEGKIFKVTVLKPDNSTQGLLSYSNQRKLVAVPIAGNSDSVRYHLTYHKKIIEARPMPLGPLERNVVFYKRSLPTNAKTNEENIQWENVEDTLSKYVTVSTGNDSTVNCAYPSIVTRYDSSANTMKTYVVFACLQKGVSASTDSIMIVESQFAAERSRLLPLSMGGQKIAVASGKTLDRWGTPSINASSQGNYYTWSDSSRGIAIGYKNPGATTFTVPRKYVFYDIINFRGAIAHPSLNTYSRIGWNENDCALVWMESDHIYYARPYYNNSTISLLKLKGSLSLPYNGVVLKNDTTVARVSKVDCTMQNEFPVVYRGVETGVGRTLSNLTRWTTHDRIVWQGKNFSSFGRYKRIFYRPMSFTDTLANNTFIKGIKSTSSTQHRGIYTGNYGLFQPDIAQGSYYPLGTSTNRSDTAMVLSFVRGRLRAETTDSASTMWHVPLRVYSFYSTATQTDNNTVASVKGILLKDKGEFAHLAARPILTSRNQYTQTRRVFQKGGGLTPIIAQTAQHFYRTGINTDEEARVISGFAGGDSCRGPLLIMPPLVDDVEMRFESLEPVIDTVTLEETYPQTDTIRTEWFTIGPSAEMTAYIHGIDTSQARLELVERTTMAVVVTPIPLETSTDSTLQEVKHTFINGGNAEYRLQLVKVATDVQYVEDILVGELEIDSVGSARMGANATDKHKVFDLSAGKQKSSTSSDGLHLASYPNPATDAITITCSQDAESLEEKGRRFYSHNEITLTVSDPMGREVASYTLSPGASVTVPTQNLASGMYIIRAQGTIFGKASATFVVQH